jgi:hypothetical protein
MQATFACCPMDRLLFPMLIEGSLKQQGMPPTLAANIANYERVTPQLVCHGQRSLKLPAAVPSGLHLTLAMVIRFSIRTTTATCGRVSHLLTCQGSTRTIQLIPNLALALVLIMKGLP